MNCNWNEKKKDKMISRPTYTTQPPQRAQRLEGGLATVASG
jgi:hypothetical protein